MNKMKHLKSVFLAIWPKAYRRSLWLPLRPEEVDEAIDHLRALIAVSAILGILIFTPLVVWGIRRGLDGWERWAQSGIFFYFLIICIVTFFRARSRLAQLEGRTPNKPEVGNGGNVSGEEQTP
jgi:hypothetical protein